MTFRQILAAVALFTGIQAHAASLPAGSHHPLVELNTNQGRIVLELYPEKAPKTVENFLHYVNSGYYNGTLFHRSVKDFIIQGGYFTSNDFKDPDRPPVPNEADNGLLNEPGTIAMARKRDPHSATTQFFINLEDNKFLNHYRKDDDYYGHTVFGRVVDGMDVVKKISLLPTTAKPMLGHQAPMQDVVIQQAALINSYVPTPPTLLAKNSATAPVKAKTRTRAKAKTASRATGTTVK